MWIGVENLLSCGDWYYKFYQREQIQMLPQGMAYYELSYFKAQIFLTEEVFVWYSTSQLYHSTPPPHAQLSGYATSAIVAH